MSDFMCTLLKWFLILNCLFLLPSPPLPLLLSFPFYCVYRVFSCQIYIYCNSLEILKVIDLLMFYGKPRVSLFQSNSRSKTPKPRFFRENSTWTCTPLFYILTTNCVPEVSIILCSAKQWRDGDWMCSNCNNHNYASREQCNRWAVKEEVDYHT